LPKDGEKCEYCGTRVNAKSKVVEALGAPIRAAKERLAERREIRDREKVMRGLKRMDTPILTGYQIFHNYVRPHEGLKGETPATKAGIKVEGDNKWFTLIQNAKMGRQLAGRATNR
jgi:hypothetical protein